MQYQVSKASLPLWISSAASDVYKRQGNGGVDLRKERPAPFVKSSVGASDPHRAETALSSAGARRRAER